MFVCECNGVDNLFQGVPTHTTTTEIADNVEKQLMSPQLSTVFSVIFGFAQCLAVHVQPLDKIP